MDAHELCSCYWVCRPNAPWVPSSPQTYQLQRSRRPRLRDLQILFSTLGIALCAGHCNSWYQMRNRCPSEWDRCFTSLFLHYSAPGVVVPACPEWVYNGSHSHIMVPTHISQPPRTDKQGEGWNGLAHRAKMNVPSCTAYTNNPCFVPMGHSLPRYPGNFAVCVSGVSESCRKDFSKHTAEEQLSLTILTA